jgi:hypothetical protein
MSQPQPPPTWLLISVLFSSIPLTSALAALLYQAAFELHSGGGAVTPVAGDVVTGRVRSLGKDMLLGTIGGPAFEAELETERGSGKVRFLLTREGLESVRATPPAAPAGKRKTYLN